MRPYAPIISPDSLNLNAITKNGIAKIVLEYSRLIIWGKMIGTDIRTYRFRHKLSQQELGDLALLNQKTISELEQEKPDAIKRFHRQTDRFSLLKSLLAQIPKDESIKLFRRSEYPQFAAVTEWVAVVPLSLQSDCDRLFTGLDIAVIVQGQVSYEGLSNA